MEETKAWYKNLRISGSDPFSAKGAEHEMFIVEGLDR